MAYKHYYKIELYMNDYKIQFKVFIYMISLLRTQHSVWKAPKVITLKKWRTETSYGKYMKCLDCNNSNAQYPQKQWVSEGMLDTWVQRLVARMCDAV